MLRAVSRLNLQPAQRLAPMLRVLGATFLVFASPAMAYETREYDLVEQDGPFEVRDYAPAVVAETIVEDDFEDAGKQAFRILFAYIGGENDSRGSISMTTPVTQEAQSEKIAMTTPVTQESRGDAYRFTFLMPAEYTLETLPRPTDPRVTLRAEPPGRFASVRYSGFWSRKNYERELERLQVWMRGRGLEARSAPVWARYDPPFMPWFWRRNEILIAVESPATESR
jgi:hypothetical protein